MTNLVSPSVATIEPMPMDAPHFDIAAFSYEERRVILPAVAEALENSGCWLLDRHATSFTQMEYNFELEMRSGVNLYTGLIAAGLELTRSSHAELTTLCTVHKHRGQLAALPGVLTVRLVVSFLEDLSATRGLPSASATA